MNRNGLQRQARQSPRARVGVLLSALAVTTLLGACSSTSGTTSTSAPTSARAGDSASGAGPVLPVAENPITNTASAQTLAIDSVLVENNEDASGKATDDHLEVALSNSGADPLTSIEVFYTFSDPKTSDTENYYLALPADFTIPAGGQRVAHFDNTGVGDHFPVNAFSLYATDTNALDVSVMVSADGAAPVTDQVKKDAGGAETAD